MVNDSLVQSCFVSKSLSNTYMMILILEDKRTSRSWEHVRSLHSLSQLTKVPKELQSLIISNSRPF